MKKALNVIIGLVAIVAGIYAIYTLLPSYLLSDFLSWTFGVLAIIWTTKAYRSLSANSSLRDYTAYFLVALVFILFSSVWSTMIKLYILPAWLSPIYYVLLSIAYLAFVIVSYNILMISKEFGFGRSAEVIKKALEDKRRKKKIR